MSDASKTIQILIDRELNGITRTAQHSLRVARALERASEVALARQVVEGWLDDDEELRIPSNDFGHELYHSLRLLVDEMKKKEANR
jgi:hypothetical protein